MKFFITLVIIGAILGALVSQDFFAQFTSPQTTVAQQASNKADKFDSHCMGTQPPEIYELSGLIVTLGTSNFPVISVVSGPQTEKKPALNASDNLSTAPKTPEADTSQIETSVTSKSTDANTTATNTTTASAIQQITTEPKHQKPPTAPNKLTEQPAETPEQNSSPNAWILQQTPKHFTLQIVSGRNHAALAEIAAKYLQKTPYAIYKRQLEGRAWYSLIVGSYPTRSAANRAKKTLHKGLKANKAWPKKFAEIHKQIEKNWAS